MLPSPVLALTTFERRYRNDHQQEHAILMDLRGHVVAARDGDEDSVEFTALELERACGGLLAHNHPKGRPFSRADLVLAAQYGLTMRAVGTAADEQTYTYIARFVVPSKPVADALDVSFDGEVEAAKRELAVQAEHWSDERWLQEARHLTISRLADHYRFSYERRAEERAISEMGHHEGKRLDSFASLSTAMRDEVFSPMHATLVRALVKQAGADGLIPMERLEAVRREVTRIVTQMMLGNPQTDGTLVPFRVQHGEIVSHSTYFRVLLTAMRDTAAVAVERHAAMMRKYLPIDLERAFALATLNPFDQTLSEADEPGLEYDPLHRWLGPDGKTLSDRIWSAAGDMRARLDQFLTEAIARRMPVQEMSEKLEAFLLPGVGSYVAMRLARTEVVAAHSRADFAAAQFNPFVESYSPFTAPSHQCCDHCDVEEAHGPYPKTDASHMPPFHPNCICGVIWHEVSDVKAVIIRIRKQLEQAAGAATKALTDFIGPLSKKFLGLLFRGHK